MEHMLSQRTQRLSYCRVMEVDSVTLAVSLVDCENVCCAVTCWDISLQRSSWDWVWHGCQYCRVGLEKSGWLQFQISICRRKYSRKRYQTLLTITNRIFFLFVFIMPHSWRKIPDLANVPRYILLDGLKPNLINLKSDWDMHLFVESRSS